MRRALERVDVAYYLIHSLGTGTSFEQRHRDAAAIFAETRHARRVGRTPDGRPARRRRRAAPPDDVIRGT